MAPEYHVELEDNIPVIVFDSKIEGGQRARYEVMTKVVLDHIIENEIVSDRDLDKLFEAVLLKNKKYYKGIQQGKEVLAELKRKLTVD